VLPAIKACGDVVVWMHAFLALSLERVSDQCHARVLEPGWWGGGNNRYLQVEDWAGTIAGLGALKYIHIHCICQESNPDSSDM
jgi:hypothetical protein